MVKKRISLVVALLLIITGCQMKIDIGPYLSLDIIDPTLNDDLQISQLSFEVDFDNETFSTDNPTFENIEMVEEGFDKLLFNIQGTALAEYQSGTEPVTIELDPNSQEQLSAAGLKYNQKLTLDPNSQEFKTLESKYDEQHAKLETEISEIKELQTYVDEAKNLNSVLGQFGIDFYLSKYKFEDAVNYYNLDIPLYDCSEQIEKLIEENNIYFIATKSNEVEDNLQTYTSFIDDDYMSIDMVEFNGELKTIYSHTNATGTSQRVIESSTSVPFTYLRKSGLGGIEEQLITNETKTRFAATDYMSDVIDDYRAVYEPTYIADPNDRDSNTEALMDYIDVEYIETNGQGVQTEVRLNSRPDQVTITEWIPSQLAPDELTDYSYQSFTMQVYQALADESMSINNA